MHNIRNPHRTGITLKKSLILKFNLFGVLSFKFERGLLWYDHNVTRRLSVTRAVEYSIGFAYTLSAFQLSMQVKLYALKRMPQKGRLVTKSRTDWGPPLIGRTDNYGFDDPYKFQIHSELQVASTFDP